MSEMDVFDGIDESEKRRIIRRAAWSVPLLLMAAASIVLVVIMLVNDDPKLTFAAVNAVVYAGIFLLVKPSVSQYGQGATVAVYLSALGMVSGLFMKVFAFSIVLILAVLAYNQIVVVGGKALDVADAVGEKAVVAFDAAKEAVITQDETIPEVVEQAVDTPLSTEAASLQRRRLEREAEIEKQKLWQAEAEFWSNSENFTSSALANQQALENPVGEIDAIDPAIEKQKEMVTGIAKALEWLVPNLNPIIENIVSRQYRDGSQIAGRTNWGSAEKYVGNWLELETREVSDNYDGSNVFRGLFDFERLQSTEIDCTEYDVRPLTCHFRLVFLQGGSRNVEGKSCPNLCYVSLLFDKKDMKMARRIENAFNDIIDLNGNREPY